MVTAYDYHQASIASEAGGDGILVGDSLGMVVMGFSSTYPVTMGMIAHHLRAVVNVRPRSLVVADTPFMSYEISKEQALRNAGKLIRLGANAVKLEEGLEIVNRVEVLTKAGIPVIGHVGLNPQRSMITGLRMRGRSAEEALEEAGAFSMVIEFFLRRGCRGDHEEAQYT
jgi:3-methyl-2-oxobutanoate hydroxymethyltransferase